jgi:hypothetical protein
MPPYMVDKTRAQSQAVPWLDACSRQAQVVGDSTWTLLSHSSQRGESDVLKLGGPRQPVPPAHQRPSLPPVRRGTRGSLFAALELPA